jgi:RimJ/RimL family protein N-acetyltransferase
MAWQLTNDPDEFERVAGEHLRADAVRQTVPLTVLGSLQERGLSAFGDSAPVFGWHQRPDGAVDGAILQTPPYPLLVAGLPAGSAAALLDALAAGGSRPAAINAARTDEPSLVEAWAPAAGGTAAAAMRSRLYLLGQLVPPDPAPPGTARVATEADTGLLIAWHDAFGAEAHGAVRENAVELVTDRLSHGGLMLWETGGEPVAMAGITRTVAGVARIAGVYTPPVHRRRGYGGGITTAASRAALAAGASQVVLFTDLANPTSNALYQRLGFEPVEDRVLLDLLAGADARPGVTGEPAEPS